MTVIVRNFITYLSVMVLCVIGIGGKPSTSFSLPGPLANFGKQKMDDLKSYSGKRVQEDSIRMVYFYDQTVAVVELGPKKLLLNCELIEVYEPEQVLQVLGEMTEIARPVGITLREMLTLMDQCDDLDEMRKKEMSEKERTYKKIEAMEQSRGLLQNYPFSLLSGVIPGTKWCGTGDIAKDYFDLGSEKEVDACCRAHDLCPVKIRSYSKRYNLTNNSIFTKSHCKCDDKLFYCLKNHETPMANILGNIFFNLVQVPCVNDTKNGRKFRNARNNF